MRRTKAEAELTRTDILIAAEGLFLDEGVARTSLDQIAAAAGVTRGAIYHHFADKYELFEALYDAAQLPQEEIIEQALLAGVDDPLALLERLLLDCIETVAADPRRQRLCTILMSRCEYVGPLQKVHQRSQEANARYVALLERSFELAKKRGLLAAPWKPKQAATALNCMSGGIFFEWLVWGQKPVNPQNYANTVRAMFQSFRGA